MGVLGGYVPGDRFVECDVCGLDARRSEVRKGGDGGAEGV